MLYKKKESTNVRRLQPLKSFSRAWLLACILFAPPVFSQVPGTIQVRVCGSDTTQRYSLYLPGTYHAGKKIPLLIFFDPAARGGLPVDKYRELADEYGIILAGSMNSRNFNGAGSAISFAAVYNDITANYAVDENKIWLSGFSGGARVASSLAASYDEVKGVIACGAGFAGNETLPGAKIFPYACLVGNMDMNYSELLDINEYLDGKKTDNIILVFAGGHAWPPALYFAAALSWFMKDKTMAGNNDILNPVYAKLDSGFIYQAWFELSQLRRIPQYRSQADSVIQVIEKRRDLGKDRNEYQQIIADEKIYMDQFNLLFEQQVVSSGDPVIAPGVWTDKTKQVRELIKSRNRYRSLSGTRCFEQSWRLCIEYYTQFMEAGQYAKAYAAAGIIAFFNPPAINADFLMARAAAAIGDRKLALKHLKAAVKNGLSKSTQIMDDPFLLKQFDKAEMEKLFK